MLHMIASDWVLIGILLAFASVVFILALAMLSTTDDAAVKAKQVTDNRLPIYGAFTIGTDGELAQHVVRDDGVWETITVKMEEVTICQ